MLYGKSDREPRLVCRFFWIWKNEGNGPRIYFVYRSFVYVRLKLSGETNTIFIYSLKNSALPNYIRYFMPGYTWLKVLYKSIDAFKKTKDTLPQAIQFLRILVRQKCHMEHRKGQWYNEWIKIEQYHRKDPNASVGLLKKAVLQKSLTRVDRLDLLEKAEKLAKRKSNIDQRAKDSAERILRNELSGARLTSTISSVTIRGAMCQ